MARRTYACRSDSAETNGESSEKVLTRAQKRQQNQELIFFFSCESGLLFYQHSNSLRVMLLIKRISSVWLYSFLETSEAKCYLHTLHVCVQGLQYLSQGTYYMHLVLYFCGYCPENTPL